MKGFITGREVVRHAFTIIRLWGVSTYIRCLRATVSRTPPTFLAVVPRRFTNVRIRPESLWLSLREWTLAGASSRPAGN